MTYEKLLNDLKDGLSPYYQGKLVIGKREESGSSEYAAGEGPYFHITQRGEGIFGIFSRKRLLKISDNPFGVYVTILDKKANEVVRCRLSELLDAEKTDIRIEEKFH